MSAQTAPLYPQPDDFKPPRPKTALDSELYRLAREALASLHADGVVIAYKIDGEITCRINCGSNAPALGATLNPNSYEYGSKWIPNSAVWNSNPCN